MVLPAGMFVIGCVAGDWSSAASQMLGAVMLGTPLAIAGLLAWARTVETR
jgi:hypothetical protein